MIFRAIKYGLSTKTIHETPQNPKTPKPQNPEISPV